MKVRISYSIFGKTSLKDASYRLFFCQKPKGKSDNYILIPQECEQMVRPDSQAAFKRFMSRATEIFNKHNVNVPCAE